MSTKTPLARRFVTEDYILMGFGAVVVLVLVGLILNPIAIVGAGQRGVLLKWGAVENYDTSTLQEGIHFIVPVYESVAIMNVQTQKYQITGESAATFDLQELTTDVALNYHIDPNEVAYIYDKFGANYQVTLIDPIIKETMKATTANFTAEEAIDKRPLVLNQIQNRLSQQLEPYKITVDQVSITNFAFSKNFSDAIENKVVAQQNLLRQLIVLNTTHIIANQTVALARGNATARIVQANGTAKAATIIQNALVQNKDYLKYLSITEWNGKLPVVVGSSQSLPLINLNSSSNSVG